MTDYSSKSKASNEPFLGDSCNYPTILSSLIPTKVAPKWIFYEQLLVTFS